MSRLSTLVIAPALPYPLVSGRDLRNWQNICALSSFTRLGVFGLWSTHPTREPPSLGNVDFWRDSTAAALIDAASKRMVPARARSPTIILKSIPERNRTGPNGGSDH